MITMLSATPSLRRDSEENERVYLLLVFGS
jgi:hypothetical protein